MKGVNLSHASGSLSHVQFADDTLFIGQWSPYNIHNILSLLRCFKQASGLQINLNKIQLFGAGVLHSEVEDLAWLVDCKCEKLPFEYLGLPVGKFMSLLDSWDPVCSKLKSKLSAWKINMLPIGGRLTLVKVGARWSTPLFFFYL